MRREILETHRKACLAELGDAVCVCVKERQADRQIAPHGKEEGPGASGHIWIRSKPWSYHCH